MIFTILIIYFAVGLLIGMLTYLDSKSTTAHSIEIALLWPKILIGGKIEPTKPQDRAFLLEAEVKHHLGTYIQWAVVHAPTLAEAGDKFKRRILDLPDETPLHHVLSTPIEITNHTVL
jgi:hypothetical protein